MCYIHNPLLLLCDLELEQFNWQWSSGSQIAISYTAARNIKVLWKLSYVPFIFGNFSWVNNRIAAGRSYPKRAPQPEQGQLFLWMSELSF